MPKVVETAAAVTEHLRVGEIQKSIGDLCLATIGFGSVPAEYYTGRLNLLTLIAGIAIGDIFIEKANGHWHQGRRRLAVKRLGLNHRI